MNIVALDYHTLNPGDIDDSLLFQVGNVSIYDHSTHSEAVLRAKDADIIIVNKFLVTEELLARLPKLKYVCVSATGYNNVDLEAASKAGISVSNVVGYSTPSVAQQVFSLILAITNKVSMYSQEVSSNQWSNQNYFSYWNEPIVELQNKTLGLYGYGNIAQEVAQIGIAFGMNVVVYHPNRKEKYGQNVKWLSQKNLLEQSDILSLHAPLTNGTSNLINKETLSAMKKSAILINTARGPLVNEKDLYNALKEYRIRAAALDVMCQEPPEINHPLYGLDNCIITPHQAWASVESRMRLLQLLIKNICSYKKGNILNKVN